MEDVRGSSVGAQTPVTGSESTHPDSLTQQDVDGHGRVQTLLRLYKRLTKVGALFGSTDAAGGCSVLCGYCEATWRRHRTDGRRATVRDRISAVVHVRAEHKADYDAALRMTRAGGAE